jgi:hypothetical protein
MLMISALKYVAKKHLSKKISKILKFVGRNLEVVVDWM